jgi:signal transduction histidine kinase/HPt (histidine-containing phosphotransfer) domain-containing protein
MSSLRSGPWLSGSTRVDRPTVDACAAPVPERSWPAAHGTQTDSIMQKAGPRSQQQHDEHILVVADDPAQATWLARTLQRQGHRCACAEPGQDPLQLIRAHAPGLVLCDSSGSGVGGSVLCAAIKADPVLRRIPVLLAGQFEASADVVRGLQCGADHLLFKPFDARYLRARLAFVQRNRQLLDTEGPPGGVGVQVAEGTAFIAADRRRLLNLLFSTFEAAVEKQRLLTAARAERDQLRIGLEASQVASETAAARSPAMETSERALPAPSSAPPPHAAPVDGAAERALRGSWLAALDSRLRPPLHELVAASEQLAHDPGCAGSQPVLRTLRDNAALLLGLFDELVLDAAGPVADQPLSHAPLAVGELIEELCTSLLPRAARHGISLTVFVSPAVPSRLLADELRLRQLLHQLLDNALSACVDPGGRRGRISVRAEVETDLDAPQLALRIADNGAGIAEDTLDALLNAPASANGERSGHSLSVCLRLARRMGGELRAASVPGAGSVFTLRLPLMVATAPTRSAYPDLSGIDCILVNDAELAVDDLRAYLTHAGARVHQVADAATGEQAAAQRGGPLVLIRRFDGRRPDPAVLRAQRAAAPLVRHLLITRGQRRHPRLEADNCVSLDGDTLCRGALLQAVALAIGGVADAGPASIDLEVLRRQTGDHPAAVRERLADFYIATRHQLDALQTALEADDLAQAARIAQRMRDACRAVGAHALSQHCATLAESAGNGEEHPVRQRLPILEQALFAVEREIATLLTRSMGTPG